MSLMVRRRQRLRAKRSPQDGVERPRALISRACGRLHRRCGRHAPAATRRRSEPLEGVLRARRFQPCHRDRRRPRSRHSLNRSSSTCAAVKSISTMPLASITSSFGLGRLHHLHHVGAETRRVEEGQRRLQADHGDAGQALACMCGCAGHQIVVPGTRSNSTSRARVVLQMPCSSDRMMPSAAPCWIGSTMMSAAVARISRNSAKDWR